MFKTNKTEWRSVRQERILEIPMKLCIQKKSERLSTAPYIAAEERAQRFRLKWCTSIRFCGFFLAWPLEMMRSTFSVAQRPCCDCLCLEIIIFQRVPSEDHGLALLPRSWVRLILRSSLRKQFRVCVCMYMLRRLTNWQQFIILQPCEWLCNTHTHTKRCE